KAMLPTNAVLVSGDPFRIGAAGAYRLAGRHDAREKSFDRTETRGAGRKPFRPTDQTHPRREEDIRLEERQRERARILQELHDTLLQGFLGASMLLHHAVEQTPADAPSKPALNRALRLVLRAIDEGRAAVRGVHHASAAPSSLEQAFSTLLSEVITGRDMRTRLFVQGEPGTLNPMVQEQLFLIGREAVMNALRHSRGTKIEVEIQYARDRVQV